MLRSVICSVPWWWMRGRRSWPLSWIPSLVHHLSTPPETLELAPGGEYFTLSHWFQTILSILSSVRHFFMCCGKEILDKLWGFIKIYQTFMYILGEGKTSYKQAQNKINLQPIRYVWQPTFTYSPFWKKENMLLKSMIVYNSWQPTTIGMKYFCTVCGVKTSAQSPNGLQKTGIHLQFIILGHISRNVKSLVKKIKKILLTQNIYLR